MERPGLLKSLFAFFVFLGSFLIVAGYLGGGAEGLAWAGMIAVVSVAAYLLFYGWISKFPMVRVRLEPVARSAEDPTLSKTSGAKPPLPALEKTRTRSRRRLRPEPPGPDQKELLARGVRNVCDPGPHDVGAGRPTKIRLEVEPGLRLVGTLEEEDGDDFEFKIVNEDNWVNYQQGRRYYMEDHGEGEGVYKINWTVPTDGPWFLVLEAYGKQLVREVTVNLRLVEGQ